MTEPLDNHGHEMRCYMRDPDGYLIEVAQVRRKGWTYSRSGRRVRHRDHGGPRAIDDGLFANLGKYANWNKNLALETLRKLLIDQIRVTERTNIVQSKKFREALEDAMLRYTNKAITTAEMISRLLDLAKHLRNAQRHGEELGLSREETAFYDPLAEKGSAKEIIKNDTLRSWPAS